MTGRLPTPTKLKRLRGNPGQRPLNEQEPQPTATNADPPANLSPAEAALWNAHAPELVRLGLLTAVDRDELAVYCRLRVDGLAKLKGATPREHREALQALAQSSSIARYFGMGGPASRVRLVAPVQAPASKWANLTKRTA